MNIVTILKSGGDFYPSYMNKLHEMIMGNLTVKVNAIYCLTDFNSNLFNTGITTLPLIYEFPGWWSKLELFRLHYDFLDERFLYMDLDTVIWDDFSDFFTYKGDFCIMRDVYRGKKNQKAMQSSIMMFRSSEWLYNNVFRDFMNRKEKIMDEFKKGGDQRYLETVLNNNVDYFQDEFPEKIVSYKVHCKNGVPENTSIIIFHGKPRPHEVNYLNA